MNLQSEIEADYIDRDGIVNPQKVLKNEFSKTGNGIAYTSVYWWLLKKIDSFVPPGLATIKNCSTSNPPGLYLRSPGKNDDQNGWDDYICLAAASHYWNTTTAYFIYQYATGHRWVFNNINPGKFTWQSWFGRSPQFRAHIYFASENMPSLLARIGWAIQTMLGSKDATAMVLTYLMVETAKGKSRLCDLAAMIWKYRMRKMTMRESLSKWLDNPGHPIVKYWE